MAREIGRKRATDDRIEVPCPCGRVARAPQSWAGKRAKCAACKRSLLVPDENNNETQVIVYANHDLAEVKHRHEESAESPERVAVAPRPRRDRGRALAILVGALGVVAGTLVLLI